MASRRVTGPTGEPTPRRKATTPEGREMQLTQLAVDLAEKQLRDGTASAQVLSHYLKASSTREYLEQERIKMDLELAAAKKKVLEENSRTEELYENAIRAMREYQGAAVEKQEFL